MTRCLLLALATLTLSAADLPRHDGYVNDFAGRLAPADRDALESRLRDYQRATTNEVAIAIVESLQGESIEDYARQLFHEWGLGTKDRNNGVLLLWAPVERKVRIQVGYGLEGTLSDSAAADILRTVTARFRQDDYVGGLNAGLDGIMDRLGGGEEVSPRSPMLLVPLIGIAGVIGAIVVLIRGVRRKQLSTSLPMDLDRATQAMREAEQMRQNAGPALQALRSEAPQEVWREFESTLETAAPELAELAGELAKIQSMPRQEPREISAAHRALKHWNTRFTALWKRLEAIGKRLDGFRYCREHSQVLLRDLGDSLQSRGPGSSWTSSGKLISAAGDTYARATEAVAMNPVNWLLVYDLLVDAQDCLQCADNPSRYQRRDRYWDDSGGYSPAYDLLLLQSASDSSSPSFDSGSSSGDSGASFGGGDSGGGGASSDY